MINGEYYIAKELKNGNLKLVKTTCVEIPADYKPPLSIYSLDELFNEIIERK